MAGSNRVPSDDLNGARRTFSSVGWGAFEKKNAGMFAKYCRDGSIKPKTKIFVSTGHDRLCWERASSKLNLMKNRSVELSSITGVEDGRVTATFQKARSGSKWKRLIGMGRPPETDDEAKQHNERAFSIICSDRTLDLVAEEEDTKKRWVAQLKLMLEDRSRPATGLSTRLPLLRRGKS
eukprot:990204-Rhodomonas_salina.1